MVRFERFHGGVYGGYKGSKGRIYNFGHSKAGALAFALARAQPKSRKLGKLHYYTTHTPETIISLTRGAGRSKL